MRTMTLTMVIGLAIAGCTPGDIGSDGGDETRGTSGETGETGDGDGDGEPASPAFAEIRCIEEDVCFGRPIDSVDAWTVVVPDCVLDELVATGMATEINGWTDETCAPGDHPSNFMAEWRCLEIATPSVSACFSGDGVWWTQVKPACDEPAGPAAPWPSDVCGQSSLIGANPWTETGCTADPVSTCFGESADDSFRIWPTCYIDQFPAEPVPECLGGSECVEGTLGCPCRPGDACDNELLCAVADNGNEVCSVPGSATPCAHKLDLELDGMMHDDTCVASCTQGVDDCGEMECSPAGPTSQGFCAWPSCTENIEIACDTGGRCWATADSWTGWAQAATAEAVEAAADAGVWIPAASVNGHKCWEIAGSGQHVCTLNECGILLIGQPEAELDIYPPEPTCDLVGPWSEPAQILGSCIGIVDGLAIRTVAKGCAGEVGCTCLPADICYGNATCQDGTCF